MSEKDKWVRRFSVDETSRYKNGFTIYKITSVLFPIDSPEAVTVVSVWKRYSDIQKLHKSMKTLHAGLNLKGKFPALTHVSFFKRFDADVIKDRMKIIKMLLEFIALHRLLFTSSEFVNFLQSGYPEPESSKQPVGIINAIRTSLHLPIEDTLPLEYQSSEEDSPKNQASTSKAIQPAENLIKDDTDYNITEIEIFEADFVETRKSPKPLSKDNSLESFSSLESLSNELFEELNKINVNISKSSVRKNILPDLINFDEPSTSTKFDDYHTHKVDSCMSLNDSISESVSICSTAYDSPTPLSEREKSKYLMGNPKRSISRHSVYSKKSLTLSSVDIDSKNLSEDCYIFEAGYKLNLALRCEGMGEYQKAFECYMSAIEKMLTGVQTDTDPQRRSIVKEKTNKYLAYAEDLQRKHLSDTTLISAPDNSVDDKSDLFSSLPLSMLRREYEEIRQYRVLAVLGPSVMLVIHRQEQMCYAMKVIQKIPNNIMDFDDYVQIPDDTRQPILPTNVPYMVSLNSYIETTNLIFLTLSYAPGEKLFNYIQNYVTSAPNTPAREVNLENVFSQPIKKLINTDNCDKSESPMESLPSISVKTVSNNEIDEVDLSVNDLVINSQRLLLDVDLVLSEESKIRNLKKETANEVANQIIEEKSKNNLKTQISRLSRDVLPPSTVCQWGAELLIAIEALHNCGVICRDLNPKNLLLGEHGQLILTYCVGYKDFDVFLSVFQRQSDPNEVNLYVAPEIYQNSIINIHENEKACDFWSYGAIMYELICGLPLSHYHGSVFTSHTILQLPDGISLEEDSLLTQLLSYDPHTRLGSAEGGIEEIKKHPYFKNIDWSHIRMSWVRPD